VFARSNILISVTIAFIVGDIFLPVKVIPLPPSTDLWGYPVAISLQKIPTEEKKVEGRVKG
jgi:hypothetical protein